MPDKLPNVRKFLKKMPQVAFRGTTKDKLANEIFTKKIGDKRIIQIKPHAFVNVKSALRGKTREIVSSIYKSIQVSLGYARGYAKVKTEYKNHKIRYSMQGKKPGILLAINPKNGKTKNAFSVSNGSELIESIIRVRGAKGDKTLPIDEGAAFSGKDANFVWLELGKKDLKDAETEWQKYYSAHKKEISPQGEPIFATMMAENFLARRMARKALPYIMAGMKTKK